MVLKSSSPAVTLPGKVLRYEYTSTNWSPAACGVIEKVKIRLWLNRIDSIRFHCENGQSDLKNICNYFSGVVAIAYVCIFKLLKSLFWRQPILIRNDGLCLVRTNGRRIDPSKVNTVIASKIIVRRRGCCCPCDSSGSVGRHWEMRLRVHARRRHRLLRHSELGQRVGFHLTLAATLILWR